MREKWEGIGREVREKWEGIEREMRKNRTTLRSNGSAIGNTTNATLDFNCILIDDFCGFLILLSKLEIKTIQTIVIQIIILIANQL